MKVQNYDLKQYVKCIYELEASLYGQQALCTSINTIIENLQCTPLEQLSPLYEIPNDIGKFNSKGCIQCALGFGIFGLIIGALSGIRLSWGNMFSDVPFSALVSGVFFSVVGLVIGIVINKNRQQKEKNELNYYLEENRRISEQNQIKENQNKIKTEIIWKKTEKYKRGLQRIESLYSATQTVLNKYYSYDIIYPKYRDFVAVSTFYEYLSSGRCTSLAEAYNMYEDELIKKLMLRKLDDIIERLDSIRDNQYMLYTAIQDINNNTRKLTEIMSKSVDSLENIDNNINMIEYHNSITSQNSEYLKMSSFFNSLLK